MQKDYKKVIIWGHLNDGHTHSFAHQRYFKAFKHLKYDTYYFDDKSKIPEDFEFDNCLFLTSNKEEKNIPLNKSSTYILHHTNLQKYFDHNLCFINLGNYVQCVQQGIPYYKDMGGYPMAKDNVKFEKIDDLCFYDETNKILYQPWGTDLLPDEIDVDNISVFDNKLNDINHIGFVHGEYVDNYIKLNKAIGEDNKIFKIHTSISNEENLLLTRKSFLTIDLRPDCHVVDGYISCRMFKNISYGKFVGTNSQHISEIFNDFTTYNKDPYNLYWQTKEKYKNLDIKIFRNAMIWVRDNHTFINRVNTLIKTIEKYKLYN